MTAPTSFTPISADEPDPTKPERRVASRGKGPNKGKGFSQADYHHPAAGWGAAKSVSLVMLKQGELVDGTKAVFQMNHENSGYDCPGCAWPDDRKGLAMDICENGIKHVTWEMTGKRTTRDFFAAYTVKELEEWSDFALEDAGRLTEPMRYDAATDKYVPIAWDQAFELFGRHVAQLDSADESAYYTSGRLSNEATFLYQLFARELGTNNLPDCSNMCHEASGRALLAAIGTGKGTCDLDDWYKTDLLVIIGVNAASNAPRMLTALKDAYKRGAQIVHINPMVEIASTRTIVPHDIVDMAIFKTTRTGTLDIQPRIGGDMALMRGVAKYLFEMSKTDPAAVDAAFIASYTSGFEAYREAVEKTSWELIQHQSGVAIEQIRHFAELYRQSKSAVFAWCLGISQQRDAVETIREFANVLLMRGNLGRRGAGPSPIRGHSNVQGNRTCGVNHHPTEEWLARLDKACGIVSPRKQGLDTVHVIPAMMRGEVKVFVGMGGNFAVATADPEYTYAALRKCDLTVQVSTKLNRSHIVHGKDALILPCLGRTEVDMQKSGHQGITVEDAMSEVHLSYGKKPPASPQLRSECSIIVSMAKAALPSSKTPWDAYGENYDLIRDKMAEALPGFESFNRKVRDKLGFRIPQPARELIFVTPTKLANFSGDALCDSHPLAAGRLMLGTMRSHDQWNTTIYGDDDRYRGVKNLRTLVLMNEQDMRDRALEKYDLVDLTSYSKDGTSRSLYGYRAIPYNLPRGCAMGYMPELNALLSINDYSEKSDQPSMKQIEVTIAVSRLERV